MHKIKLIKRFLLRDPNGNLIPRYALAKLIEIPYQPTQGITLLLDAGEMFYIEDLRLDVQKGTWFALYEDITIYHQEHLADKKVEDHLSKNWHGVSTKHIWR